jgi:hypothetical protein
MNMTLAFGEAGADAVVENVTHPAAADAVVARQQGRRRR